MPGPVVARRWSFVHFSIVMAALVGALCLLSPSPALAQQGPIAAYSFDEDPGEGTTLEDVSGGEHTATIEGAEWTAHGRYGGAMEFDASSHDALTVADAEDLDLTEELTLEAWVRPSEANEYWRPVLAKEFGNGEGEGKQAYSLYSGQWEQKPYGQVEGPLGEYEGAVGEEPLPKKAWSHIAFTFDGAKVRFYVDGKLTEVAPSPSPQATAGDLEIGAFAEHNNYMDGRIDEIRIYNRALSEAEVEADRVAPIQTPQQGPIAAYSFDQDPGEGTTIEDISGNEHTATIHNAEWTAHGRYGGAMEFSRPSLAHLTVADAEDLDLTEELTIEAWVRPSGAPHHYWEPIAVKPYSNGKGEAKQAYSLFAGQWEEKPHGAVEGPLGEYESATGEEPLPKKAWSHVAFTFDGAKVRLYVDGKLTEVAPAPTPQVTAGDLEIGSFAEGNNYFDGRIDELRIYNRALSEAEIASDRSAPIQTPQQGPIAAYSFDDEASPAEDLTGGEHDGTLEGATWTPKGKYGGALAFDGENDCLSVPESADFQFLESEEFTLEAWVRPERESLDAIVTQEDDSPEGEEEPFSYSLLSGSEEGEGPRGWLREGGGEYGHTGVAGPDALPLNAWSHIAFTDDGAKVRIYLDGELIGTNSTIPLSEAKGPLTIGCLANYGNFFKGRVDEVRVYGRALNEAEIRTSMVPLPTAVTETSIETNDTAAVLSGTINPRGGEATYWFEYGPTNAYGQYGPSGPYEGEHVVIGDETVEVLEAVPDLEPNTTYHYRLVAYNGVSKTVGPDRILITAEPEVESLSASGQIFGLNYRSVQDAAEATTAHVVAESNATMFRVAIGCPDKTYDEIFEHAAEEGVTILPYIVGVAEAVKEIEPKSHHFECPNKHGTLVPPPEEHEAWKQQLEAIVGRYGHGGTFWAEHEFSTELIPDHWEIWNEENTGRFGSTTSRIHPAWYGSLLEEAQEAVTNVNPKAKILIGGLLSVPKARPTVEEVNSGREDEIAPTNFLKQMGHYNAFDVASLHPYAFKGKGKIAHAPNNAEDVKKVTERVWSNIKVVRAQLNNMGSSTNEIPIWITEIGWPVRGDGADPKDKVHWLVSEDTQRDLLNSTFEMMKGESKRLPTKTFRLSSLMYYNVADAVNTAPKGRWDFHCGLVKDSMNLEQGKKRKAWYAFQAQAK